MTFRIIFNVVYNYLKFVLKYYFIKKNISNNLDNTIKQIINIQEFELKDSLCGFDLFQNLIWIHLFEKVFSVIPKKKIGFYLFENQSWEKAFVVAWKKYNHGILIGCIPTTINYWHLNYYYSKKELSLENKVFSPNLIFSNSNYNCKELKNFNLYSPNVKKVESLRFNYLNKVKFNTSPINNNKILFLGDYSDFLNKEFLSFFFNFQKSNKNFKLFVKPHPVSNFFLNKKISNKFNYKITYLDTIKLASRFNIIISSNSTSAGLEFLILKKFLLVFDSYDSLDLSPFKNYKVPYIKDINQLNILKNYKLGFKKFSKFYFTSNKLNLWKKEINKIYKQSN